MCDECAAMADLDRCLANASSREKYSLNAAMRDFTLFWITSAPTMHPECGTWTSELNFHVSLANTCWDISLKKTPQNLRGSPSTAETIRPSDGQSHISIPTDRLLARLKISQDAFVINVWKYELFKGFFQESQTENMHSSCDTQCSLPLLDSRMQFRANDLTSCLLPWWPTRGKLPGRQSKRRPLMWTLQSWLKQNPDEVPLKLKKL